MHQRIMENSIRPVATPQDAITQFIGEQYLDWVMDYASYKVRVMPALGVISEARPKPEKIKKFLIQLYLAEAAYLGGREGEPGLLGFAVSNLSESSDPLAEHALNLIERQAGEPGEAFAGSRKERWLKLLAVAGASAEEIQRAEVKEPARNYVSELSDVYSNSEWQTTMGAFAARGWIAPHEHNALRAMLQNNLNLDPESAGVLDGRLTDDPKSAIEAKHVLERVAVDREGKELIFTGVSRQLQATEDLYNGLLKYIS